MPASVIPVLSLGQDQLTRPADQIAYIIRHAFYNPGWTSSYIEFYLISLQKLFAECHHNLSEMAGRFREKLMYTLRELYEGQYEVNLETYRVDDFTQGVKVNIVDQNQNLVLSLDDIRVSNNQLYIKDTLGEIE